MLARELLLSHETRLVSITGPGGVGKTHLAMVVTQNLQEAYADGIFWIALAATDDPEMVITTIARDMQVLPAGANLHLPTLCAYLRDKKVLLVLDNCEHLLASAPYIAELLERCPGLTVLVTSRAVLRIRGEHVLPISPLPLPDLSQGPSSFVSNPAVALFVARARALEPRFRPSETDATAIAEICWRLDGLPLAIELAAAHIQLFSPRQILARLSHRLDLFKEGRRDLPSRQSTLRSSIQWSYDLLPEDVQRLFRRLCFFTRDCDLTAITSICHILKDDTLMVERGVGILLDHHLLQQSNWTDSDRQFMLLDTVREFGLEELAVSGEMEKVRAAYTDYLMNTNDTQEVQLYISEYSNPGRPTNHSPAQSLPDASIDPAQSAPLKYPAGLTEREVQVLRLMVQGLTNKQIAKELILSPHTINVHVTSIYNKIGVNSRSAATRFACTHLLA